MPHDPSSTAERNGCAAGADNGGEPGRPVSAAMHEDIPVRRVVVIDARRGLAARRRRRRQMGDSTRDRPAGRTYRDRALARRLWEDVRPHRGPLLGLFLLGLAATPVTLLAPLPLKIVVDSVIGSHPPPGFVPGTSSEGILVGAVLLSVGVAGLTQLLSAGYDVLRISTGEQLTFAQRARLFARLQRLSLGYHDTRGTADSVYRVQYDALAAQYIVVDRLMSFLTAGITVVAMLYVTGRIDVPLGAVAAAVAPVMFAATWLARPRLRRRSRTVKHLESRGMSVVQEALAGARVVKAFGQEDREVSRFAHHFLGGMSARIRYGVVTNAYAATIAMVSATGAAAVLYVGAHRVQSRAITLGDLVLVMGYLSQLYAPIRSMSRSAGSLQADLASAERVYTVLDEHPDVPERPGARPLQRARGDIVLDHVSFSYDGERPVLHDVCLQVPPGCRVGIAGATGAGKSTLVSLLNRLHDPAKGRVLLDGVDLRDLRVRDVRRQFAIVLQEPMLFSTSVRENIAYARPDASQEDVERAAAAADVHEFVASLPAGYETLVGERGMRLSGGERQRISLARAFLKDAPILILDEPTSSVDLATEQTIMSAMARLMAGRTTFMIAHRLSTLDVCDMRVELRDARIHQLRAGLGVPMGSHNFRAAKATR
jgi:ATP-binding cassette, subfamily B, bacterial